MNNHKVKNRRQGMEFEIRFTHAYKEAKQLYTHPAQLELACLQVQFPEILHEIEENDLFAGRIQYGAVGLGIQHQTGGFGFYCDEKAVVHELETAAGTKAYREGLHELLTFWRSETTGAKVMAGMPDDLKLALPSDAWDTEPLPATPILRMAGTYLDYDKLMRLGIPGLISEMETHLDRERQNGGDPVLFECAIGELELVKTVCRYYRDEAAHKAADEQDEVRRARLEQIASSLQAITERAPASLHEGIQLAWIYSLLTPAIEFGRVDVYLGDLYAKDIDSGAITEADAVAMMQSYFRLIDHLDCETDGRVIIGGYGRRNPENADRFCLVAIEACRTVREILPQFTLRFNQQTPKTVWEAALRCIAEGRTYPLLYHDDALIPCIMNAYGVDRKRAESYVPLGCGEIEFDHYSIHTPSGALNVLKILEIAMNGGWDPVGRKKIGPQTKRLDQCESFEEFLGVYKLHLDYYIAAEARFEKYEYEKTAELHPFLYVTMLYDGACQRGKSIFDGGCASLNGTLEVYGLVNAADSLVAIRKLVYQDKKLSGSELLAVLRQNFQGCDAERRMMLDCPKFGNDDDTADNMVVELQSYICAEISGMATKAGLDTYLAVIINNAQNTTLARYAGASPDGRKAGTPYANANNPSSGSDKNGITAMLNSLLKMPQNNNAGTVQNLRISRELYNASPEKFEGLLQSYFERGGVQIMITVVGRDELRSAMEDPEAYRDLIVRIGGFSARFVDLPKDVQQEIFDRVTY